jgi:hypothetical protein
VEGTPEIEGRSDGTIEGLFVGDVVGLTVGEVVGDVVGLEEVFATTCFEKFLSQSPSLMLHGIPYSPLNSTRTVSCCKPLISRRFLINRLWIAFPPIDMIEIVRTLISGPTEAWTVVLISASNLRTRAVRFVPDGSGKAMPGISIVETTAVVFVTKQILGASRPRLQTHALDTWPA